MSALSHIEPLQRFTTDEFTLRLDGTRWGLYKEGLRYFWIDDGLVQESEDFTPEEIAMMIFDKIIEVHCNAAQLGFDHGVAKNQEQIRKALGITK